MGGNENLKSRRREKGFTQNSIADVLGVSLGAYRNWEQGINYPDKDKIVKLTELLETTADYLLEQTDNPLPRSNTNNNGLDPTGKYLMDEYKKASQEKKDLMKRLWETIKDDEQRPR